VLSQGISVLSLSPLEGPVSCPRLRQAVLDANTQPGADRTLFTGQAHGTITPGGQLDVTDNAGTLIVASRVNPYGGQVRESSKLPEWTRNCVLLINARPACR
jgi:hypothetical protein